ncbi:phosphate/phosphite/phosphonate ABC transporter substrate-binding protein [Aeromicrobium sp. CTD01-1L150]|uniref:phosphate/phosphite/phosphonate ABC transporter substrate-binding protein n=1 Tax=Aeromicrobium sp. CTD01-1L150 TaxID=3341830 RepID=UPI0035BFEEFC
MHRTSSLRLAPVAGAAVAALLLAACSADGSNDTAGGDEPDTLVFASIPSEEASNIALDNEHIIAVLEDELDVTIETQEATDYAAVIEGMRADQVDIAAFGPFSYVTAHDGDAGAEPVAALVDDPQEEPGYVSYGIVADDSDIQSIEDFAGQQVCFVDRTSTSGFLYPSAGLLEAGIDPLEDVEPVFAGGHDASALSTAGGDCDAGFAYDTMVDVELVESGQLSDGDLRVVWESPVIPGSPYAVSDRLSQDLRDKITEVFTDKLNIPWLVENGYCDSEEDCTLPEDSGYGFVAVDDDLYQGIRDVCEVTRSESCIE